MTDNEIIKASDVREKLVEIVNGMQHYGAICTISQMDDRYSSIRQVSNSEIVDGLIAHGVTVQEFDGCEYCREDREGFRRMFGAFSLVNPFHGNTWQIHAGKCKPREINFCPMCGRRLPQPPKGEK